MDYHKERTLIVIKPDGVRRGLIGEVIKRFEDRGLKVVGLKALKPTAAMIKKHYQSTRQQLEGMGNKTLATLAEHNIDPMKKFNTADPMEIGKVINSWNVELLTAGMVVAIVFEGVHAVTVGRKIVGNTIPAKAEIGTIRGDYSTESPVFANDQNRAMRNIVHASGDIEEAQREISLWFDKKELHDYKRVGEDLLFG